MQWILILNEIHVFFIPTIQIGYISQPDAPKARKDDPSNQIQ